MFKMSSLIMFYTISYVVLSSIVCTANAQFKISREDGCGEDLVNIDLYGNECTNKQNGQLCRGRWSSFPAVGGCKDGNCCAPFDVLHEAFCRGVGNTEDCAAMGLPPDHLSKLSPTSSSSSPLIPEALIKLGRPPIFRPASPALRKTYFHLESQQSWNDLFKLFPPPPKGKEYFAPELPPIGSDLELYWDHQKRVVFYRDLQSDEAYSPPIRATKI